MTAYRLHYFPESGNSYKLALMLALCGQSFDPIWTDFGGGVTRTAEWRSSVNEMGEIPVLEDSGVRLTQTRRICKNCCHRGRRPIMRVSSWKAWHTTRISRWRGICVTLISPPPISN